MKYILIILIFYSCNNCYEAKCKSVCDGDSFYIGNGKEIRLYGCDAPEATRGHFQPYGIEATNFTRQLIEGKTVTLITKDHDKYGREVCKVILSNGSDLSELILKAGLAFTYPKYDPVKYCNEEETARINKVGLWRQTGYIETPFHFRHTHKH